MPSMSPNVLKSARLSSLSKIALAYSPCWLTTSAKLVRDKAIPLLSPALFRALKLPLCESAPPQSCPSSQLSPPMEEGHEQCPPCLRALGTVPGSLRRGLVHDPCRS